MDINSAVSRDTGITDEELRALADHATSPLFSELDRLALRLAEHMTATPAEVPPELFDALRGHLDEPALLELASAIAWENYRARFNRVFDIGSDDFSAGAYCAVPARLPPGG